ncbi:YqaE/Pmp3 family membrane protein [Bizionia sp. KMM 8389]
MSLLTIILNIFIPPLSVFLQKGLGGAFFLNLLLTLVGWLPGVIHAFIVSD